MFEDRWEREDGQTVTREHLLMTLADLDAFLIKGLPTNFVVFLKKIGHILIEVKSAWGRETYGRTNCSRFSFFRRNWLEVSQNYVTIAEMHYNISSISVLFLNNLLIFHSSYPFFNVFLCSQLQWLHGLVGIDSRRDAARDVGSYVRRESDRRRTVSVPAGLRGHVLRGKNDPHFDTAELQDCLLKGSRKTALDSGRKYCIGHFLSVSAVLTVNLWRAIIDMRSDPSPPFLQKSDF